ncbi:MAG: glutamate racemase [Parasphingorhabdus sp.]
MTSEFLYSEKPLLFFDTGIGGLSVLGESLKLIPNAPVVYAADYAGLPYGMKSEAELAFRIPAILGRLVERYQPELVTIACNTASTIALEHVRTALDLPVVGTVPAIKPASKVSKTGTIGLLGTRATIRQPYVDRLAMEFAADKKLIRFGAPDLVYAAEAKLNDEKPDMAVIGAAVEGLISQDGGGEIDTIILACTHFPLVKEELQSVIDRPIQFVDGAKGIARQIAHLTKDMVWSQKSKTNIFVTTGDLDAIEPIKGSLGKYGFSQFETL